MTHKTFHQFKDRDILEQLCNLRQLTFEITDTCNLNCKYCGYGKLYNHYDTRTNQRIDYQNAIGLIDYLVELWNSNINYSHNKTVYIGFYGGEPLLNINFIKQIIEYIEKLPENQINFSFNITTNGLLLDKYIDFLVEKDFNILISLDGNKNNNEYRINHSNENSFDNIYKNVKLIMEKHPYFFKQNIDFNSVLHNKNNVPDILDFFKKEFNKTPQIAELSTSGIRKDKIQEFKNMFNNKHNSILKSKEHHKISKELFFQNPNTAELGIFLMQYSGNVFSEYNQLLLPNNENKPIPTGTCLPFGKKMFVTVNSKILVCERISHQYSVGEITKGKVMLDFQEIADKYNNYYRPFTTQCTQCYKLKTCTQCIFSMETKDKKPYCRYFMNKEKFEEYASSMMDHLRENPELYEKIMTEVTIS